MVKAVLLALLAFLLSSPVPAASQHACTTTKVVILGAGVAGMTAAQTLSNNLVSDFVIVEYNAEIGGRCRETKFGNGSEGIQYTVELGANWVQGTVTEGGPENPIWTLAKKYNLRSTFSNFSSVQTYTENGSVDYRAKKEDFEEAYAYVEQDSGLILSENLQDRSFRAGLNLAGYKPVLDPEASAWEWFSMDFEYAQIPDVSSQEFTVVNYNSTYYGFSEESYFVHDRRGISAFLHGEASTFLAPSDPRLLLSTIVTNISYSPQGVTISNKDGSCISADYAICTFSVGVLQSDLVTFDPPLPEWKRIAIETFQMGVYTKIFIQFPADRIFWNPGYQYLLYASPQRGYYPIFQPLDLTDFLPGSGILIATVVSDQSRRIEAQSDERTKAEILAVLRNMFGADNVPEPIDFMYPRWSQTAWARGSYSNWPPGLTLEGHQNLRANLDRLWFAGEATSQQYYGFLQGAWFEGKGTGEKVAALVNVAQGGGDTSGGGEMQGDEARYVVLKGTTTIEEYGPLNGWNISGMQGEADEVGGEANGTKG